MAVLLGTVLPKVLKPEPKETPTPSPPQEIPQELESLLSSVSFDNGTALQTPSTPQNDALIWLANNTNLDSYSDARKIQRYVLATLYYSTNGAQWVDNSDWLTDLDECTWYTEASRFILRESVPYSELDLSGNNLVGTIPNELALLSSSLGKTKLALNVILS